MGRPVLGLGHLDRIEATPIARQRLELVLRSAVGNVTGQEAAEQLGLSEQRFSELRTRGLQCAAHGLEPGSPGRPRKTLSSDEVTKLVEENRRLERENRQLRAEIELARVRTQLALVLPHVLRSSSATSKKGGSRPRRAAELPADPR